MKECFLIISYCDTDIKVDALKKCINNLKQFKIDMCLYAHYPISNNIQNDINYYIYDKSNPIFKYPEKSMHFWRNFNNFQMEIYVEDYGYSVIQMIKRGFNYLKNLGYDRIFILNYDVILDFKILDIVVEEECNLFYWDNNILNPTLMCLDSNVNLDFITKENYKQHQGDVESYIDEVFNENIKCIKHKHETYKNYFYVTMSADNKSYNLNSFPSEDIDGSPWDIYNFQDYKIHIGNKNDDVSILVFSVNKDINIKINNYNCEVSKDNFLLYHPNIKWDEFSEDDINITIDNIVINKNIIKSFIDRNAKINSHIYKNVKYKIINKNRFDYYLDDECEDSKNIKIEVEVSGNNYYTTKLKLDKGINYYTILENTWYNKTVKIYDDNEHFEFELPGSESKLTKQQQEIYNDNFKVLKYDNETELCEIMTRNESDKGDIHGYTRFYHDIFKNIKDKNIKLFELGVGSIDPNIPYSIEASRPGTSLYGWSEYFKNGKIYGADIDISSLFNTDKIKTFYCDQTKPYIIRQMWDNKYLDFKFDIIIEDGYHSFDANVNFFENSYHKLKNDGVYIIEDIDTNNIVNWLDKIREWGFKFPQFCFELIELKLDKFQFNNVLLKIKYNNE